MADGDNYLVAVEEGYIYGEAHKAGMDTATSIGQKHSFVALQTFAPHQTLQPLPPSFCDETAFANQSAFRFVPNFHQLHPLTPSLQHFKGNDAIAFCNRRCLKIYSGGVAMTKVWKVDPKFPESGAIAEAAEIIRKGGLVAFPTETVYGLGANALDENAVRKIFAAKERPAWDPLIVHICDLGMVEQIAQEIPDKFHELAERFMPGPLTVVLRKKPIVPDAVTAGLPTVAVRMPNHPVALALIRTSGVPIAAPSANRFGRPSPTTAEHVLHDLAGRIDGILDAGPTQVGIESTVLDLTKSPPTILRPGGVSKEDLEEVLGKVTVALKVAQGLKKGLPSPGMMPRHYAPSVPVILTEGEREKFVAEIERLVKQPKGSGQIGALAPVGWLEEWDGVVVFNWGKWGDWDELARKLFEGLRWLERQNVSAIVAPLPPPVGLGLAIRDRLIKASSEEKPTSENPLGLKRSG